MTTKTESLAAQLTKEIAASIPAITAEELFAREVAKDHATAALRAFIGPAQMDVVEVHNRTEALDALILGKLGETYTAEINYNAAAAALLGELAKTGISAEDYATLTVRWFAAFDGK